MNITGLCIACAHYKELGLWMRDNNGQTPSEPQGLCFACRDAAEPVRGPCDTRCLCGDRRRSQIAEEGRRAMSDVCVECGARIKNERDVEYGTGVFAPDGYEERQVAHVFVCENGHEYDEAETTEGEAHT